MNFRSDYLLHFAVSSLLCLTFSKFIPVSLSCALTLSIGIAKELIWDKAMKKGCPEWQDIVSDIIGILYAFILTL